MPPKPKNKVRSKNKGVKKSDPMEAENFINAGDLVRFPRGFEQPRLTNQVYKVRRLVSASDITQQALTIGTPTFKFRLADVPDATDFTTLFDQYRFVAVRIVFRPRFNMATVTTITVASFPRLTSVIDYDDDNALGTLNEARQYQSVKETRFDEDHVRFIKPRMAMAGLDTGFNSVVNVRPQWIDCASTSTYHYAIKCIIDAGVSGQTALQSWSVDLEYYLEFKQVR